MRETNERKKPKKAESQQLVSRGERRDDARDLGDGHEGDGGEEDEFEVGEHCGGGEQLEWGGLDDV